MTERETERGSFDQEVDHVRPYIEVLERYAAAPPEGNGLAGNVEDLRGALADLVRAGRDLEVGRARYQALFRLAPAGMLITDDKGVIREANPAAALLFQSPVRLLLGKPLGQLVTRRKAFRDRLARVLQGKRARGWRIEFQHPNGDPFTAAVNVTSAPDGSASPLELRWVFQEVPHRPQPGGGGPHLAGRDRPTGLANRTMFGRALRIALARANRRGMGVALLYVDIDGFSLINDSLGPRVGDEVLRQMAARLEGASRGEDIVSHFGGDEFAILLADLDRTGEAGDSGFHRAPERVIASIDEALVAPCVVSRIEVHVSASIGVARMPTDALTEDQLMQAAVAAMQTRRAKRKGSVLLAGEPGVDLGELVAAASRRGPIIRPPRRPTPRPDRSGDHTTPAQAGRPPAQRDPMREGAQQP